MLVELCGARYVVNSIARNTKDDLVRQRYLGMWYGSGVKWYGSRDKWYEFGGMRCDIGVT